MMSDMDNLDENVEDQRPRQQSLGGVLRREGNWRCLLLSALLAGCIAAAIWCRLAQVQKVVINFSVYPIKRTRQMSPCDDGYIYIPVAFMGLLYLVYLVECYHCTARLQLAHRVDVNAVVDRVRAMRLARPKVWWKAVCYHYVRRKRQVTRYRNGDSYTTTQVYYERVNTHSASATFVHAYCGYKDVSRNLILDSRGPITKIRFSKGFAFSNLEAASEFEDQRSRFFADHERYGDYMEMREGLDLVGVSSFKEYMVAYRDTDSLPWYSSHLLFWVLSCLLLSWPLRILIECNTSYVHYTITKIFGVNYDLEATRQQEMEQSANHYLMSAPHHSLTDYVHSSQTAILAGQGPSSSLSRPINILALARSRNNLDQSCAMSHTSTIDSLELFATIRENCALVPSYSEALLLSSRINANQNAEEVHVCNDTCSLVVNERVPSTSGESNYQSTIIGHNLEMTGNKYRVVEAHSDEGSEASNKSPIHTTQSNYSLKAVSHRGEAENRKSWSGFLPRNGSVRCHHGSARIRPVPMLSRKKNSFTSVEDTRRAVQNLESQSEIIVPMCQIESIDRNLLDEGPEVNNFFFASRLMEISPDDPFGGRRQTTPTEDPPPYEVAVNMPVFRRITRSVTDRGELFSHSRSFISDTILNRRSYVEGVVSGAEAVRLLPNGSGDNETSAETNL